MKYATLILGIISGALMCLLVFYVATLIWLEIMAKVVINENIFIFYKIILVLACIVLLVTPVLLYEWVRRKRALRRADRENTNLPILYDMIDALRPYEVAVCLNSEDVFKAIAVVGQAPDEKMNRPDNHQALIWIFSSGAEAQKAWTTLKQFYGSLMFYSLEPGLGKDFRER